MVLVVEFLPIPKVVCWFGDTVCGIVVLSMVLVVVEFLPISKTVCWFDDTV